MWGMYPKLPEAGSDISVSLSLRDGAPIITVPTSRWMRSSTCLEGGLVSEEFAKRLGYNDFKPIRTSDDDGEMPKGALWLMWSQGDGLTDRDMFFVSPNPGFDISFARCTLAFATVVKICGCLLGEESILRNGIANFWHKRGGATDESGLKDELERKKRRIQLIGLERCLFHAQRHIESGDAWELRVEDIGYMIKQADGSY